MDTERAKELINIIDNAKAELRVIFAGSGTVPVLNVANPIPCPPLAKASPKAPKAAAEPKAEKKTRNMSPEGRERIAAAARLRWAKQKGQVPAEPAS